VTPLVFVVLLAALAVALFAIKRFVRKKDVLHGDYVNEDSNHRGGDGNDSMP
jgi:hypothetical protein